MRWWIAGGDWSNNIIYSKNLTKREGRGGGGGKKKSNLHQKTTF